MKINLRLETPKDWQEVELLTRRAFWDDTKFRLTGLGCDEHYLVYEMRKVVEFISELDYIAEVDGKIAGNIMYSHAYIEKYDGSRHNVINFGPLSVLPEYQKKGVGSALMRHTLKTAAKMGYGAVVFFGHPTYYPRFGFKEAGSFRLKTLTGRAFPAFMAMELHYGDLDGVEGRFIESPLFHIDENKAKAFDMSREWE